MLGALYSLGFHLSWTIETQLGGYRWHLLLSQLAPHLGWLFGAFDGYGFLAASLNLFEFFVAAFCATLLYSQVRARPLGHGPLVFSTSLLRFASSLYGLMPMSPMQRVQLLFLLTGDVYHKQPNHVRATSRRQEIYKPFIGRKYQRSVRRPLVTRMDLAVRALTTKRRWNPLYRMSIY